MARRAIARLGVTADERQIAYERRLREQIEGIVTSVVGPGRARVQVTADFDFNRVTQTSEKFDPEGRVMRSSQTREESSADGNDNKRRPGHRRQRAAGRPAPARQPLAPAAPRDQSRKSEEIVNYEISRSTKTEVTEGGRVNRVSVAVLVDGSYAKNDKGEPVYQPREKEEIDRIAALVRTAIGFDQKRGDQVEVVNLRFAEVPTNVIPEPHRLHVVSCNSPRTTSCAGSSSLVMAVLGLLVMLFVVRPLVRRIISPGAAGRAAGRDRRGARRRRRAGRASRPAPPPTIIKAVPSQTAKMIDIAQVQGQVHAQSVQKVGELADRNPNETVSIIRTWLHESAA